jgi:Protein of unknown function (DUF2911)
MPLARIIPFLFCIALLHSCASDQQQPVSNSPKKITAFKDTGVQNPDVSVDKSPMDISYCPSDYPLMKEAGADTAPLIARVIYSRPQVKGRIIFGDSNQENKPLQPNGKTWRLGANEATEIEFFRPVKIGDRTVETGRYIIYCIPDSTTWTIVFNKNLFAWGRVQNKERDILKAKIPVTSISKPVEYFTMYFEKKPAGAELVMQWANKQGILPIGFR